jgi:hypothetical protein
MLASYITFANGRIFVVTTHAPNETNGRQRLQNARSGD